MPQWDAILEPVTVDRSAYSKWLPKGGPSEDEPGAYLGARVYLRAMNGSTAIPPQAKFTFFLKDVSREPGICMNFPHRNEPSGGKSTDAPYDLRIMESSLFLSDLLTGHEPGSIASVLRHQEQCDRSYPLVPCARWRDWFRWWTSAHFGEALVGFPVGKICFSQNSTGLAVSGPDNL
ncbi:MAG: hypothetical protein M5U12_32880 [Verrucomicrobia bacterium]|nr:hypothetical protein [Verrucomicrobiota bacterium]